MSHTFSRRSTLRLLGGAIAVAAAATTATGPFRSPGRSPDPAPALA
ncbi:hypothetical protein O1M63_54150 [Streptomyces mirabilis]|nr:hypothetical protein [Streptomyces mirabilis]